MSRSVWKGPFVDGYLLKKAETVRASGRNDLIRTWSRRSTILPQFVGLTLMGTFWYLKKIAQVNYCLRHRFLHDDGKNPTNWR